MDKHFEIIKISRLNFIALVEGLTIEQLNTVPAGFNNNIAWNFGHIVVATQGLCYRMSGLPLNIDEAIVDRYKKGTKPESFIPQEEIDYLKSIAISNIEQLEADYKKGVFLYTNFKPYTTSFNVTLHHIEDSIAMVQSHDALHYGYAMAQKKLINQ